MNIEITDADVLRMADAIVSFREMKENVRPRKELDLFFSKNGECATMIESLKAWRLKAYLADILETYYSEVNASNAKAYEAIKERLRAIADGSECGMRKGVEQ